MSFTLVWPSDLAGKIDVVYEHAPADRHAITAQYHAVASLVLHPNDHAEVVWLSDTQLRLVVRPWPPTEVLLPIVNFKASAGSFDNPRLIARGPEDRSLVRDACELRDS
jgi:hypothetical protein